MKIPCVLAVSLLSISLSAAEAEVPGLKDVFAGKFLIGTAVNADVVMQADHPRRDLVIRQFNAISPTNLLKWGPYNLVRGQYREDPAEAFFAFGQANHQYILAHCLFWHEQVPPWVFEDDDHRPVTREGLLGHMRARAHHLGRRYGARMDALDVVNETIMDDGSLRDSAFTKVLGADFVPEAFRIAQEEFPASVKFLYNDYNLEAPGKVAAVVKMVKDLRAQGLRIDAVGNQAHWRLETPTIAQIEASVVALQAAGVKVHFTELDIEMLPRDPSMTGADVSRRAALTQENNPYPDGLPPELQAKLAQRYADIFTLFLKHAEAIERVTFWGVTDADSWLNFWPVRGRTNYPLLFDRDGKPKPAFEAVVKTASGKQ